PRGCPPRPRTVRGGERLRASRVTGDAMAGGGSETGPARFSIRLTRDPAYSTLTRARPRGAADADVWFEGLLAALEDELLVLRVQLAKSGIPEDSHHWLRRASGLDT